MKLTYDREADAAYLQIVETISPGAAVRQIQLEADDNVLGQFILDFDSDGKLLGVEVLFASDALPKSLLEAAENGRP